MLETTFKLVALALLILIIFHMIIRVIRYYYKFPMPHLLANIIDNPLRRAIQPPAETANRHGLRKGMRVLEVGPGNGRYTMEAAKVVGPGGVIVTIDIEKKNIERVSKRAEQYSITNVFAEVADIYKLPYKDSSFDLAYMIAVLNEIPDQERALKELYRVLKPEGLLVISELFLDPDYPLAATVINRLRKACFELYERQGNFFYYTLKFKKV